MMEVEGTKVLNANATKIVLDLKRKRQDSAKNQSNFVNNYSNFTNSLLPQRVLFSENGGWTDFDEGVVGLVQEGFEMKKAVFEVGFRGGCSLFDFLYMIMVDFKTGFSRAIAWIDEGGKCYFPVNNNEYCVWHCDCSPSPPVRLDKKRFKSEINTEGLASKSLKIKDRIEDRMGFVEKDQMEHAEKQLEATEDANFPYAGFCTSKGVVVSKTVVHEPLFIEQQRRESTDNTVDHTSYSADSLSSSYTRASYYDDDENSSDEEVSSVTSISSVDSRVFEQTQDPAKTSKDENATSKFTERSSTPIRMSFATLLGAIEDKVSYRAMKLLYTFYDEHKNKMLSKDEFVGRIKQTVRNDTFLMTTIKKLQGKQALASGC